MHRQTHRPPGLQMNRPTAFYSGGEGHATA
jgi:hypothetical protein